ncbi:MAG TPA: 30S ribosomal protein S6e [archaeon]|nr:30S ribosomal protein S6e [archaeon]
MPTFKFVIGHKGKSYQVEKDQKDALVAGKKIGDIISGEFLGLSGYELQITGGSDKDGFPMRKDIEGMSRKKILIGKGIGLKSKIRGLKRRRSLRGNLIADDIVQINCKVNKEGERAMDEILNTQPKQE